MTTTTTTMQAGTLATRAMLATFSVSQWSARKLDRKATRKTTDDAQASADAARVNKYLLAGQDTTLKAVQTIASAARAEYYRVTLPWTAGSAILPIDLWHEFTSRMTAYEQDFMQAVDAFITDYTDARDRAARTLGSLFSSDDFPTPAAVRAKFSLSVEFDPLPVDWRVSMTDADADYLRELTEKKTVDRFKAATENAMQRLYDRIEQVAIQLPKYESGEQKKLYDSLMDNLADTIAILPALNVTNDPALAQFAADAAAAFAGITTSHLKESDATRARTAQQAAAILGNMAALMGKPAPTLTPMPEPFTADDRPRLELAQEQQPAPRPAPAPRIAPAQSFDLFAPPVRAMA